jgi:hypothetical protein
MQRSLVLLALITLVAGVTFAQTEVQSRPRSYIFQSIDFPMQQPPKSSALTSAAILSGHMSTPAEPHTV